MQILLRKGKAEDRQGTGLHGFCILQNQDTYQKEHHAISHQTSKENA